MNNSNNRNKNLLLILAGAAAGAAATYYLNTPQGKKMTKNVIDKGLEIKDNVSETTQNLSKEIKNKTNRAITIASEKLKDAQSFLDSQLADLNEQKEEQISNFQSGVQKAKNAIMNGEAIS